MMCWTISNLTMKGEVFIQVSKKRMRIGWVGLKLVFLASKLITLYCLDSFAAVKFIIAGSFRTRREVYTR